MPDASETARRRPLPKEEGDDEVSAEAMWAQLAEEYMYCQPQRGDIREATILEVKPGEVIVDIGAKVNGVIAARELEQLDEETLASLKPGRDVLVYVLRSDYDGEVLVSIKMAQTMQDWQRAQEYLENEVPFAGEVVGYNRGGLLVQFGRIQGFLPASQIVSMSRQTDDYAHSLKEMVGQKLPLKVIEVNPRRRRLILSERQARQEWQKLQRRQLIEELQEGDIRQGVVSSLCDFGAFVDLGGVDGLIHISEISWERIQHPQDVLKLNQPVKVLVLSVDREKERIALSLKRLQPDPWISIEKKYREGQLVEGTITNILKFGAFASLEPGIEGLIHISELSPEPIDTPEAVVHIGDRLLLRILQIDAPRHRIALSLTQVTDQDRKEWALRQQASEQEPPSE